MWSTTSSGFGTLHHARHSRRISLFLQKISDGFGNLGEVQNKSTIVARQVEKVADLMHSSWRLSIQYLSNHAQTHGYSFWRYHMTQELDFAQPELALAKLHIKLMITQSQQHNAEMLFMLFLTLRKDQDDVNEDHDKLVQLFHENWVHEVSGGIGQTKRHHQILVPRFRGGEKPMTRIGTGYLDRGEENQDSLSEGISWSTGSFSFSEQATKADMLPYSQGREGIIFWWWKLRDEDEL
jgi:hypothetical protein